MRKLKINKHLLRFLFDRSIVLLFFLFFSIIGMYNDLTIGISAMIGFLLVAIVTVIDYNQKNWKP